MANWLVWRVRTSSYFDFNNGFFYVQVFLESFQFADFDEGLNQNSHD